MTYAHTRRILLAAVAVLPLLVPPSAVAWDLLPLEDRLAFGGHGD